MKQLLLVFCLLFTFFVSISQVDQPFYDEILAFRKADSVAPPKKNSILFVGSSSFRLWTDVQNDFPGYTIINRGFGGSSLVDVIRYEKDIIFPYAPKQIVIYCGENDFAASDTVGVQTVFTRFVQLFTDIRTQMPSVPVAFVSIKPSPSRAHLMSKVVVANRMIQAFLEKQPHTRYIDVYSKMLTPQGRPMPYIFLQDSLHMNRQGYEIWKREVGKALIK